MTITEEERERIFRRVWLNVGRIEQIPAPGDYFVKDLEICRTSILIVRGEDGTVNAFHHMCSHRGNRVVWDTKGSCKAFACKYHCWTYGLDGALRTVTDEKKFFGLDKKSLGLTPVLQGGLNGLQIILTTFTFPDPKTNDQLAKESLCPPPSRHLSRGNTYGGNTYD